MSPIANNPNAPRALALPITQTAPGGAILHFWMPVQLKSAGRPLVWSVAGDIRATTKQGALLIAAQRGWLATPAQAAEFIALVKTAPSGNQTDAGRGVNCDEETGLRLLLAPPS